MQTLAQIDPVVDYIVDFNIKVLEGLPQPYIREALLSGGDPMLLTNKRLAQFLYRLADAGITTIRIGTKELAFFPRRFDANFFEMLDQFQSAYPGVRLVFMTHFTHPAEFLETDQAGGFIKTAFDGPKCGPTTPRNPCPSAAPTLAYKWLPAVLEPVQELLKRGTFVSLQNQTPIIKAVNDSPAILRMLQRELCARGLGNHYIFQCRDIPGKLSFALPVESAWEIFTESQKGLSGIEKQARFVMSTEQGKIEVVNVSGGLVTFKVVRCPSSASYREGDIIVCKSRPGALWFKDYLDAVLIDPGRVFETVF